MNNNTVFTDKDASELTYILHNAPVGIFCRNKEITHMNGLWYGFSETSPFHEKFKDFHDAVCWLLNPFWEEANGHPYE